MKTIKRAFFVLGPESSDTRMITEAIIRSGALGVAGHRQRLDSGFEATDQIVFRRSVPHADAQSPAIATKVDELRSVGFKVLPLLIMRDLNACAASQVRNRHAVSEEACQGEDPGSDLTHLLGTGGRWPLAVRDSV